MGDTLFTYSAALICVHLFTYNTAPARVTLFTYTAAPIRVTLVTNNTAFQPTRAGGRATQSVAARYVREMHCVRDF